MQPTEIINPIDNHHKSQNEGLTEDSNPWSLTFSELNGWRTVFVERGLSAQICFAKYLAFKTNSTFVGHACLAPLPTHDFVQIVLSFVYNKILELQPIGEAERIGLYSPGVCNVPYLIQTANLIYLPSHFLIGVSRVADVEKLLEMALAKGYKCYAILGYDSCIEDQLCAWIKFVEMPPQYVKLIEQRRIRTIIVQSVCDPNTDQKSGSERGSRLMRRKFQTKDKRALPGDIYINFVNESYGKPPQTDIDDFCRCIKDIERGQWLNIAKTQPLCDWIIDWESGIDEVAQIQEKLRSRLTETLNVELKFYYLLNPDSWQLYLLAFYLGRKFLEMNEKRAEGIVFNQYFMCNPTYELNYGYLPILYWQFYPHNKQRILEFLSGEEKKLKRWLNMHRGTQLDLVEASSVVIKTDNRGKQLAEWVTKYRPLEYKLRFLNIAEICTELSQKKYLFIRNKSPGKLFLPGLEAELGQK